jgi:outer membrane protein OmpA-like peptidoglycan-associated protein
MSSILTVMRYLILFCLVVTWGPVVLAAPDRIYMSPMEESRWTLSVNSPIRCEIEHIIPRFGKAMFYQESGRPLKLKFVSKHDYKKDMAVAFQSVTANWKGVQTHSALADLKTSGASDPLLDINSSTARYAYFELQQGKQPSLFFIDDEDGFNSVSVILSTVRFRDIEAKFGECISQLHPDNFEDIKRALVHFEFDDEFPLEEEEDRALSKILEYMKVDPGVKTLSISGHADFKGTECYNDSLSARRAWYVYDYLVQSGVDPKMLEVMFYGENRPLAKGKDDKSRAINRRVSVTMVRE